MNGTFGQPPYGGQGDPNRMSAARLFRWIRGSGVTRSDDRWIGGVCGGLARSFGVSPTLVRAVVFGSVLLCGFGASFYAFAWFVLPDDRDGSILCERLLAGKADWNCAGCLVLLVIGMAMPGAGWAATLLAAGMLWLLIQRQSRRLRGQRGLFDGPSGSGPFGSGSTDGGPMNGDPMNGGPTGYGPMGGGPTEYGPSSARAGSFGGSFGSYAGNGQPGSRSWAGAQDHSQYRDKPMSWQTPPAAGAAPTFAARPSGTDARPAPAGPAVPSGGFPYGGMPQPDPSAGVPGLRPGGDRAGGSAGDGSRPHDSAPFGAGASSAPMFAASAPAPTMTSAYRAPVSQPAPRYERRKPAGPFIVAVTAGLILLSAAGALYLMQDFAVEHTIRVATIWIAAVCLLIGAVMLVLGLAGRRAGGLVPIAWIAAIVAACVIAVNGAYSVLYFGYSTYYETHTSVNVTGYATYPGKDAHGDDSAMMNQLRKGVAFDGADYDNDRVHLDLSDFADDAPHKVTLNNGDTVQSVCPTGTISLAVSKAQVYITLPDNCSFAFGNEYGAYDIGSNSFGNRYSVVKGMWQSAIGLYDVYADYARSGGDYSADGMYSANGSDQADWGDPSSAYLPQNGPELIIAVPYAMQGRIFVRYPAAGEHASSYSSRADDSRQGGATPGASARNVLDRGWTGLTTMASSDGVPFRYIKQGDRS